MLFQLLLLNSINLNYNTISTELSNSISSSVTLQLYAKISTPSFLANLNASPNLGSVSSLGENLFTLSICIKKIIPAPIPNFLISISSNMCFFPLSVGASGNLVSPFSSKVTPFTSKKYVFSLSSCNLKSNLEFPKVFSLLILLKFTSFSIFLFLNASSTTLLGI